MRSGIRRQFLAPIAAIALALTLVGFHAVGASAAQQPVCTFTPADQPQSGVSTSGEAGSASAQGTTTAGEGETCTAVGEPGVVFSMGGAASTCTMTLPEGAMPGSTVVVTTQSGAVDGATGCSIQVIPPGGFGFGINGFGVGDTCVIMSPNQPASGIPPTPEAGSASGTDVQPGQMQPGTQGSDCGGFS